MWALKCSSKTYKLDQHKTAETEQGADVRAEMLNRYVVMDAAKGVRLETAAESLEADAVIGKVLTRIYPGLAVEASEDEGVEDLSRATLLAKINEDGVVEQTRK